MTTKVYQVLTQKRMGGEMVSRGIFSDADIAKNHIELLALRNNATTAIVVALYEQGGIYHSGGIVYRIRRDNGKYIVTFEIK